MCMGAQDTSITTLWIFHGPKYMVAEYECISRPKSAKPDTFPDPAPTEPKPCKMHCHWCVVHMKASLLLSTTTWLYPSTTNTTENTPKTHQLHFHSDAVGHILPNTAQFGTSAPLCRSSPPHSQHVPGIQVAGRPSAAHLGWEHTP